MRTHTFLKTSSRELERSIQNKDHEIFILEWTYDPYSVFCNSSFPILILDYFKLYWKKIRKVFEKLKLKLKLKLKFPLDKISCFPLKLMFFFISG